jgi:hypothetical protein
LADSQFWHDVADRFRRIPDAASLWADHDGAIWTLRRGTEAARCAFEVAGDLAMSGAGSDAGWRGWLDTLRESSGSFREATLAQPLNDGGPASSRLGAARLASLADGTWPASDNPRGPFEAPPKDPRAKPKARRRTNALVFATALHDARTDGDPPDALLEPSAELVTTIVGSLPAVVNVG